MHDRLSAAIYVVLVGVIVVDYVWVFPYSREIGVALTALFLTLEVGRAPALQRNVGLALAAIGLACAWAGDAFFYGLVEGIARAKIFLVMFFAVLWLREPAVTSPALRDFRDAVMRQPPGRRYPILWLSAHALGSVLNLAAMSLLAAMASEQKDHRLRRRLAIALMMGFSLASAWGPFYISTVVILSAIPDLTWGDVAPFGIALSMFTLGVGWFHDRIFLRRSSPPASVDPKADADERLSRGAAMRTCVILATLILLVMGIHQGAGLPIPIALAVIAPPFAIIWSALQAPAGARWSVGAKPLARKIYANVPSLRNEATAFTAASVLGVGVSTVVPPEEITRFLQAYDITGDAVILGLIFGITFIGACGFHPVILAILVAEVLPPEAIGIPPEILALAMLGVWGLATMSSPFSATTLFMSRVLYVPSHFIAWRWNVPVVILATFAVAAYVVAVKHLFFV